MISRTPLHIACSKGCLEITKELLEFNAKVNVTDNTGKTPLLLAIEAKSPECVKLLLDYHADLTFRDQRGDAAIHYAVSQNSIEILSILLAAGVSANTHNEYGLTPIHMAAMKQSVEMLTFLLENEAEVNCVDQKRRSALMLACINGNQLIAEMLLRAGADPKLKDVEGFTALKYAKMYHNQQCADLVKKSVRCESRREFDQTPDLTTDAAYNEVPQYSQEGSDEIESCDKNRETSLSDNVILEKPPLPPGVSSLATSSNSRTNQSNPNNSHTAPNNLFRFPTTAASSAEDETGEEILDLVSTSDEDEASGITSEPSSEVEMKEEGEEDEQEQEMGDNIGDESGETFVFLHEISKGKFEEQTVLSDSSYISDLIHVDMIGPRSVHFAKSTVGSALDLTRKPLELDSTKDVHQPASPVRQDPVRCVSSRPTSITNELKSQIGQTSKVNYLNQVEDQGCPVAPNDKKTPETSASNKSEHSISTRSDKQMSELGSSVLRGQRPSPDGGTVTTPSPPAPSVSEDSVASTTVQDVSVTEPMAHECDLNDLDVIGPNEMELKPSVSNGIRQSQDLLVHPTNCEGDSWQSDTDSHGKEEMRKLEAAIGQKIREHARLSFLSQSTPHLTTPSASEPIATEPKAIPKQTLWDSGPSAADIIDEGSCWDSSEDEKPKDEIPAENSKISKANRIVEEIIAAKFQSEKRIWMYDEFQSNEDQTADDWDSDSASQGSLMAQNGKFTSNGVETVTVVDGVLPNTKENGSLVPGSLIGPLKQAVEWESDPEDKSTDSECQPVVNYPQTGFTVDGGETRFLVQKMDLRLTEFGDGRPKSEELNGGQNNEKASTGFRSASENDQVVVSVQSAGSDDEDSRSASLSPIAEAEEDALAVEGDMTGFGATRNKCSGSGYVRGSPKQNNMPKEFKPHERTGSEKADHQTVLLSASNRFVDNEMTEADDIPIIDEEGIAVGQSVHSRNSPKHKSTLENETHNQITGTVPMSMSNAVEAGTMQPVTRNACTLNSVPTLSDRPRIHKILPSQIPRRNKRVELRRTVGRGATAENKVLPREPVQNECCGDIYHYSNSEKNNDDSDDYADVKDHELATENEIMLLEDFDEHVENQKWQNVNTEHWETDGLSSNSKSSKSRLIPKQHCVSNNVSGFVEGLLPIPRTVRSSRSHTKENGIDATIQDTDSITLASNTEPLPMLIGAKNAEIECSSDKAISTVTEPECFGFDQHALSHSVPSEHAAQGECTELESERKADELAIVDSLPDYEVEQENNEMLLALGNACRKQRPENAVVCHESSNSTAAADLLRARLIQALQALSRERACHEELELARDAAKARVRELTLLQAQAVAVGTVEQNLSEVSGGQGVKHYAELNSKLMDYRFLLLEEQEKRKYAEEKLNKNQIEMENKEKQIAKLLTEKSTLEQKASESTMKAEGLCVENKKIENVIEDLKLKLELSQEGLKRVANLKVDVLHVQEKLESLKNSWKEDFSNLEVQLEQNKCLQMKQADHFNNTLPKRFEAHESSVQVEDLVAKERLDSLTKELTTAKNELEQKCLQMTNLEEAQNRISRFLKQIEEKLSDIMNTEETIYNCLESSFQEPPSSETESVDDHFITPIPDGLDRFRAFLEVLKASKGELNHCVYQIHHAVSFENQSEWNEQNSSDINEFTNTSTVAVEQLAKLGQSLTTKERESKQLRLALDQAQKEQKKQQSDLHIQLNQAKDEIAELNQRLQSLQNMNIVKQPQLWTRFTQTEPENLSNNEHSALAKPKIYQGNMTEPKVNSLSASMSSSIGSITKIQDRSCSPIEQLSSCDTRRASDKSGHVEVNKVFWCETCLRQNRRVEFDGITPKYPKNATAECPCWLHCAVPPIISHDTKCPQPIISYQTQSHPTTGLLSPRCEAQKTSDPEPEIAALRRRISELEADRDWLARENSRLVDRTEKQTRLTEKLTTRLSQQNQTATMPSSIYPSTQYALPQPVVVPSSCVLASSPYVTPHLYYQLKDPFMSREDPYVTPQRRPLAADRSIARELLSKTCHASNTGPETADYPEVDQCNLHESTWSLDQDLDGDSVNAQLLESRKCVQRKKLGDRLFNDTFDQLKPELERSINRHLEAADASRTQLNTTDPSTAVDGTTGQRNNSISLILRNAELSLKTLKNQRRSSSKSRFNSANYLDFLKQKYFV
ncbi:Ankyrin repeat domain containing protein [Fasciola hepatica]|uniref:Ankyrin repeat domain containing protein n=1 Tax=Fasciola hepatica TaxID=6192 RepID=A0A4E0RZ70_FASHE|nr:Ankyrin repeat domain containing protein [Fasciola hepatica]